MELRPGYKPTAVGMIPEGWDVIDMSDLCTLQRGFDITEATRTTGYVPVYTSSGISYYHDRPMASPPGVVTGRKGLLGKVFLVHEPFWPHDTTLWVKDFRGNHPAFVALVLQDFHLERLDAATSVPTLNRNNLAGHSVAIPSTNAEQQAIAEALSDADALIDSLEQLLAKKRQIKQGAMQELLTGKKRLLGFSGGWESKPFDRVLTRYNAKPYQIQASDYQAVGRNPVVDQGQDYVIGFSDDEDKLFRCPEGGVIVFGDHTCIVKFVCFDFSVGADGTQILGAAAGQCTLFHALQLQHSGIPATGYNRHFRLLKERQFVVPPLPEQSAIAAVLSDMDAELSAVEAKLAKARQIKQGMMRELLTGRIRLV